MRPAPEPDCVCAAAGRGWPSTPHVGLGARILSETGSSRGPEGRGLAPGNRCGLGVQQDQPWQAESAHLITQTATRIKIFYISLYQRHSVGSLCPP